jgi:uncharacterized protein (TIGR02271 family)
MADLDSVTRIDIGMPVHDWNGSRVGALDHIDEQVLRFGGYEAPVSAIDRIRPDGIFLKQGVVFPARDAAFDAGRVDAVVEANLGPNARASGTADGAAGRAGFAGGTGETDTLRVPMAEEQLRVEKRPTQGVVEVRKRVEEVEEVVREALGYDVVEVERVPVNRRLDGPIGQRMDGEWLVVPVMEEVLVVEKRLVLKEEVRIRTRRETRDAELREHVRRERLDVSPQGDTPQHHVVEVTKRADGTTAAPGSANDAAATGASQRPRAHGPDATRVEKAPGDMGSSSHA